MGEKLDEKELVTFKELLMANSIQVDTLAQLLVEKGIITEGEFFSKLKQVQIQYKVRDSGENRKAHLRKKALTLGWKRSRFTYSGTVGTGVTLLFRTGKMRLSQSFFRALLDSFGGKTVPGGFNPTRTPPGSLGEWVRKFSIIYNTLRLLPSHACYVAAVLSHEGYLTSTLEGRRVILHFKNTLNSGAMDEDT